MSEQTFEAVLDSVVLELMDFVRSELIPLAFAKLLSQLDPGLRIGAPGAFSPFRTFLFYFYDRQL